MPVWVSLLRGVNLGRHNQVNMPRLREALSGAGFQDVRSYVQSGNLITRSSHRTPARVAAAVREVVGESFGIDVPVVVRSPRHLRDVLAWCPFPETARSDPTKIHVLHLDQAADPDLLAGLLDHDWGDDHVAGREHEVVIRYHTTMHGSRLQYATVLRRLGVDGTARNWRTLSALVDMCAIA